MTDEDPEEDVEDQADEQGGEEQPEMTDEEIADLGELADQVEEATAPDPDELEDADQEESDQEESDGEDELEEMQPEGESWGDMYVGTLTTVSNAIIDQHGTEDAEPIEEELARQLHIDAHFDDWMAKRGKSDMPPEQALLISTTMFLIVVIGTKTDLPAQLLEEADL